MNPEVSVVIPTRNRWSLVARAVGAAFMQAQVDLEVIVVVDGGTDETAERLRALADPRLRVVALATNVGVARARNHGAALARGEWLSFLDDDDIWAPQRTRAMLDAAAATAGAGLVMAGRVDIDPRGGVLNVVPPPPSEQIRPALFRTNRIGGPSSAMVRRTAFVEAGGFDPEFNVLADWELWLRVLARHRAAAAAGVLNGYTVHEQGMHVQQTADAVTEYAAMRRRHTADGTDQPEFDDQQFMRWIAMTHRRAGRSRMATRTFWRNLLRYRGWADLRPVGGSLLGARLREQLKGDRPGSDFPRPAWLELYRFE